MEGIIRSFIPRKRDIALDLVWIYALTVYMMSIMGLYSEFQGVQFGIVVFSVTVIGALGTQLVSNWKLLAATLSIATLSVIAVFVFQFQPVVTPLIVGSSFAIASIELVSTTKQ